MSAGSLPLACYHRTSQLGEGSFGRVVIVFNDDGEQFALKLFFKESEEDPLELGTLREISCLRYLRGATPSSQHPNIIRMEDLQPEWSDDEQQQGAGTAGCLGMAMPCYPCSLESAIHEGKLSSNRRIKVQIAHDILSAVDFLHTNDIMHRDIKGDNVLLQPDENASWRAVLTDFSLAKASFANDTYTGHTGEVCTLVYAAPEVLHRQAYDCSVDLWSAGVILLELLRNGVMPELKAKQVLPYLEEAVSQLAEQPFPNLIRGLLQHEPSERLTSSQALKHELFFKFQMDTTAYVKLSVDAALPLEYEDELSPKRRTSRLAKLRKALHHLGSELQLTVQAAYEYSIQLDQLEENLEDAQGLLDCAVLAYRFFELETLDLNDLDNEAKGPFANWSLAEYVDTEATLFMLLDFCLYPRGTMLSG